MRVLPSVVLVLSCLAVPGLAAELAIGSANPDTFDIQDADPALPCTHHLTGEIASGDGARVVTALRASLDEWRENDTYGQPVLCLDSAGGALAEALKIADVLRDEFVGTKLEAGARCESACAMIFMAGSFHAHESGAYKWRILHPTARLGFHAPSLQVPGGNYDAATVTKSYGLALETIAVTLTNLVQNRDFEDGQHVKPSLLAAMLRTPPQEMMYVDTVDQAGRWGIRVGPVDTAGLRASERDFRRACANKMMWDADESGGKAAYWEEMFVNYTADEWGETIEVIFDNMTGDGCTYAVPKGTQAAGGAPFDEIDGGYVQLVDFLDPRTPLSALAR